MRIQAIATLMFSASLASLSGCGGLIDSVDRGIEQINKSLEDVNANAEATTEPTDLNSEQPSRAPAPPQRADGIATKKQPALPTGETKPATSVLSAPLRDEALLAYHAESKIDIEALVRRMARWEIAQGHLERQALNARKAELRSTVPAAIAQTANIPHYTLNFPVTFNRYDKYQHYYYFSYDDGGAKEFDYGYGFVVGNPKQFSYVEIPPNELAAFKQTLGKSRRAQAKLRFTVVDTEARKANGKLINGVLVRAKAGSIILADKKIADILDADAYSGD